MATTRLSAARRVVPRRRDPDRPHARRLGVAFSTRRQAARARASTSCATTSRRASAARRATGRSSRRCRSASTSRCGSTTRTSTSPATSSLPDRDGSARSSTTSCRRRCRATARCGRCGSPTDLDDGRIGIVGKAHHCMVDGIAAVELASLLLDPSPTRRPSDRTSGCRAPAPAALELLAGGDRRPRRGQLELARAAGAGRAAAAARAASSRDAQRRGARARRLAAAGGAGQRAQPPISPLRHLGVLRRPLDDLRAIKRAFGATRQRRRARRRRRAALRGS